MRQVLHILAHPYRNRSKINKTLWQHSNGIPGVERFDLYETYPHFQIDRAKEKDRILKADVILFQHPFYWYSCPALMKQWIDVTLEKGFAYGPGGTALQGKFWAHAISAGGSQTAYQRTGHNHFTMKALLRPFEQSALLCGMVPLEPFIIHGVGSLDKLKIEAYAESFKQYLSHLVNGNTLTPYDTLDEE